MRSYNDAFIIRNFNIGTTNGTTLTASNFLSPDEIRDLMGVYELNGNLYWINPSIICAPTRCPGQGSSGYLHSANQNEQFAGQVFINVPPGQTGNLPRAFVNGPGYWNLNMAVLKNFNFGENTRAQFGREIFNVFNNVNFRNNTQLANITSVSFGQITSAADARAMQFALRFEF